jgi:hypothetical protein
LLYTKNKPFSTKVFTTRIPPILKTVPNPFAFNPNPFSSQLKFSNPCTEYDKIVDLKSFSKNSNYSLYVIFQKGRRRKIQIILCM